MDDWLDSNGFDDIDYDNYDDWEDYYFGTSQTMTIITTIIITTTITIMMSTAGKKCRFFAKGDDKSALIW